MPSKTNVLKPYLRLIRNPAWLCFAWFGKTAAISLHEAPVKFTAPTITREIALDVGRVVFSALNKVELAALVLTLVLVRASGLARQLWAPCAALVLILLLQSVWLLPELSQRSLDIVRGVTPGASPAHLLYGAAELAKLLLLLIIGFRSLRLTGQAA
ncbi:MAG: hypothetical protein WBN23_07670 [Woeseia sp.]